MTHASTAAGSRGGQWPALAVFLLLTLGIGAAGGLTTASSVDTWYRELAKPAWTPPSWVFGPVWTALYVCIAVAGWLVWRRPTGEDRPMGVYWAQLALNAVWSPVFFGLRSPALALAIILLMLPAIVLTIVRFRRVSPPAAWLLAPYLCWVSYATTLNAGVWWLNRP